MKQYLDVLNKILTEGVEKESGRPNMPNTIGISNATIRMDLSEGFTLLTTKKMFLRGVIHELLWMLRGETNIKYLVDNNVHIWDSDAYRWYQKHLNEYITPDGSIKNLTIDEFIEKIKIGDLEPISAEHIKFFRKRNPNYVLGDLGKVYGYQWRNQNGVDQVRDVIEGLRDNPYSRYHIIDGWNKVNFKDMALPPCHLLYQFIVRPLTIEERKEWAKSQWPELDFIPSRWDKHEELDSVKIPKFYLDLNMYQRSADACCGIPFNLASMSLLLMIVSNTVNMIPGISTWIGGDSHIYIPHIEEAKKQIQRQPYKLPKLQINKKLNSLEDIEKLTVDDFILSEYNSHPSIKYDLFVGLKKEKAS